MRKIGKTARPGWFVSLSQTKGKKPEISSPQAVCEVVSAAPPSSQCKLSTFGCFLFFPHSALLEIHPPRVDVVVGPWQWLQRSAHERQGDQLPSLSHSLQISFVAFAALLASPVVLSNVMVYPLYS
jgi:hypothetical protein